MAKRANPSNTEKTPANSKRKRALNWESPEKTGVAKKLYGDAASSTKNGPKNRKKRTKNTAKTKTRSKTQSKTRPKTQSETQSEAQPETRQETQHSTRVLHELYTKPGTMARLARGFMAHAKLQLQEKFGTYTEYIFERAIELENPLFLSCIVTWFVACEPSIAKRVLELEAFDARFTAKFLAYAHERTVTLATLPFNERNARQVLEAFSSEVSRAYVLRDPIVEYVTDCLDADMGIEETGKPIDVTEQAISAHIIAKRQ